MKSMNCLMDFIPYHIFKIILNTSLRGMKQRMTATPAVQTYVDKIQNRVTFKINTRYYLFDT